MENMTQQSANMTQLVQESEQVVKNETSENPINISIQQKIKDLQRIQELQRMQRMKFLEQFEQNRQKEMVQPSQKCEKQVIQSPTFSKINLINSSSNNDLRCILNEFNKIVCSSLDKVEHINIEEFKTNLYVLFETISKYNQDISSWYDDKFNYDRCQLFKNIINADNTKFSSYAKLDFISI